MNMTKSFKELFETQKIYFPTFKIRLTIILIYFGPVLINIIMFIIPMFYAKPQLLEYILTFQSLMNIMNYFKIEAMICLIYFLAGTKENRLDLIN